jgi:ribosomal-protein-alanine N-acetyltransferase
MMAVVKGTKHGHNCTLKARKSKEHSAMSKEQRRPLASLHSARWALRPIGPGDQAWLLEHWSLPLVRRWLWDDRLPTPQEVREIVESSTQTWADPGYGFWGIAPPKGTGLIGTVGFRESSWEPGVCELVYSLDPAWWGKGIATEVSRAAIEWVFTTHGWLRIVGATDTPNLASARVLEKIGMRKVREGTLENGLPTVFYELTW